ncbi:MAG TPA: TetR/AcrR family transcriptional regulator [Candidatus Limnocylindria bacterium]|nr:TetR/AcrR family transcriptional regulator [Candidatus Limnocylindria bacterium]
MAIPPKRVDGRTLRARPRAPGAPPRSDRRRQAILDAGALLMQQRGFVGTTVEDVANQLELTKAAFYYYVENKEELLFQISSQTLEVTDERISAIARSARAPGTKLNEIVDSFVRLVADRPEFFSVYFQEKGHLGPAHLKTVTKIERKIVKAVERVYREGAAAGTFRKIDPAVAAFGILGLCFWIYQWYRPDGRLPVSQLSTSFQALASRGYLAGRRGDPLSRSGTLSSY